MQASLEKNERYVYKNISDKRERIHPKFKIGNFVGTPDSKDKHFLKSAMTNWSYKLYKITEIFNDTIPSYKNDNLQERFIEAVLQKTELTLRQNDSVMKRLNITWIRTNQSAYFHRLI